MKTYSVLYVKVGSRSVQVEWIAQCRDEAHARTLFSVSHPREEYLVIAAFPSQNE